MVTVILVIMVTVTSTVPFTITDVVLVAIAITVTITIMVTHEVTDAVRLHVCYAYLSLPLTVREGGGQGEGVRG